ncbi:MAG: EamA family transporter [Candidatus Omnitrophica bacterium]|nr:EamA family transporter [Candidatus Omnitrophota bacterium]
MKKPVVAILSLGLLGLVVFSDLLESLGELFYKKATLASGFNNITFVNLASFLSGILHSHYLWIGIGLYVLNFFFWIVALSKADLSVVYPVGSTHYVIVMILAFFFLHESISPLRCLGVGLIIIGVWFIFQSTQKSKELSHD